MVRLSTFCVACLLLSDALAAGDVIDEVTVTATRRATDIEEIAYAVGVAEATTPLVTDALRSAVGVFVQQTTPGQGAAIIRGLKGSAILHTVDGMRLNNAIFRSAPTQYLALVPGAAVERLEVVRGSPTSLYGSDAVGGVVQVVTHKPSFDSDGARGTLKAAFDTAELTRDLQGRLDVGNESLAASFSGSALTTGDRRTGSGERIGPSDFEAYGARMIVAGKPDDARSWFVDAHYVEQPETPRVDELVAGFGQTEPDSDEFLFAPNTRSFLHGQYEQFFSDKDWTIDVAWQRIEDDRRSRGFESTEQRLEENSSNLFGLTSSLSGKRGDISWIGGVELYHDTVDSSRLERDIVTGITNASASRFPDGSSVSQAALFASGSRSIDSFMFSGGLRLSKVDVDLAETELTPASRFDVTDLSGDLGLIVNFDDAWQATANASFGFRAPNIFDLGTLGNRPGNRFNIPNTSLDSEHVIQFDAGLRYFGSALRFELVAFHLDYTDRITSVSTGNTTVDGRDVVQSINAAEAVVYGIDAGFDMDIGARLSLHGLLNYARGEQRSDGNEEPADRMPPLNGRLRLDYQARDGLLFDIQARFASEQNRLSARDVRDNRIDPDGTPGWVVVDVGTEIEISGSFDVRLAVDNILDRRYRYHGSGIDAPGRNFSVILNKSWN